LIECLGSSTAKPLHHFIGETRHGGIVEVLRYPHARVAPDDFPLALLPFDIRRIKRIGSALVRVMPPRS
jgi:hypothetical protein